MRKYTLIDLTFVKELGGVAARLEPKGCRSSFLSHCLLGGLDVAVFAMQTLHLARYSWVQPWTRPTPGRAPILKRWVQRMRQYVARLGLRRCRWRNELPAGGRERCQRFGPG